MDKPKAWGDVFWGHIIASKGMMDRADSAYRADQWKEREARKIANPSSSKKHK